MLPDFAKATKNVFSPGTVEAYFSAEAPKASWDKAAINLSFLYTVSFGISLIMSLLGIYPQLNFFGTAADTSSYFTPAGLAFTLVTSIISLVLILALIHFIAGLFGGKDSMDKLVYLYSLAQIGLLPLSLPLLLLVYIPLLACAVMIANFIVGLYGFFLLFKAVKALYKLESLKAAAVVILTYIVAMVLYLVFYLVLFFAGMLPPAS
ncbi:MAG: YIP1 family protein [Candidatus Micrarchaeota archaeon]